MFAMFHQQKYQFQLLLACRILLWGLIFVSSAVGQYRFDQWTADNGLPQNSVYDIRQTRDGYIWLATVDGLVRFDGVSFTIFNKSNSPGIVNNRFIDLNESPAGDLWAGTEESGMVRYRQRQFTSYGAESGLPNPVAINFMAESTDGNLLLIMRDSKIYRFVDGKFSILTTETNSSELIIPPALTESRRISCSFPTESEPLICLANGQTVKIPITPDLKNLKLIGNIQAIDGTIWLLTEDAALIRVENGKISKVYRHKDGLLEIPLILMSGAQPNLLSKDKEGAIWLTNLKTMQNELLTRQPPAAFTLPFTGYEDREGNLWIGSLRDGLFRIRKQVVTAYSKADGLLTENVYPIYEDRRGIIWIGTTKGVFKYENDNFTLIKSSKNFYVEALGEDALGRILASSSGSLYVLEGEQFKRLTSDNFTHIFALYTDRENALWIGGTDGLVRLKDNTKTTFTISEGLAGDNVKVIIDDKNGGFWVGSYGGLTHYSNGKFEKWTESSGLLTSTIRALYLDADNVLWIGSYDSGLARFKDGKFTYYNSKNGLYNDGVFQILEDNQRNFWINSNRGIYRVKKDELNEYADGTRQSITSIAYGKSDGMPNVEGNGGRSPAGIKARDGRLWFPTQGGAAVINPSTVKINPQPPPVIIEDIKIDDQSISIEMMNAANNPSSEVRIEPQQQNFEVKYTALSFINAENLHFKYKLEGLDTEWIDAGTRRTAYFSHIPAGGYTFRIIAANADGVWNETGASIKIRVLPPFYRTWWFFILSVLIIAAIAYLLFRRRIAQLERARLAQQEFARQLISSQEQERKRIAVELHDSIGQSLAMIKNDAVLGSQMASDLSEAKEQLADIVTQSSQAMNEIREIAYNLRPYLLDRLGLTKAIRSMLNKVADSAPFKIISDIQDIDGIFENEAEISIYRIIQESLNNILKHAGATEVLVSIKPTGQFVIIKISDDGSGFDVKEKSENKTQGGFGLLGMSERVKILNGTLLVESEAGKGAVIRIELWKPTLKL